MKQIHKKNLYLINPEVLLEILCHWREYKPLFIVHIIVELQRRNFYAPPIKDQATLLQIINDICQDHFVDNVNDLIQLYDVQSVTNTETDTSIYNASVNNKELTDEFGLCWNLDY